VLSFFLEACANAVEWILGYRDDVGYPLVVAQGFMVTVLQKPNQYKVYLCVVKSTKELCNISS